MGDMPANFFMAHRSYNNPYINKAFTLTLLVLAGAIIAIFANRPAGFDNAIKSSYLANDSHLPFIAGEYSHKSIKYDASSWKIKSKDRNQPKHFSFFSELLVVVPQNSSRSIYLDLASNHFSSVYRSVFPRGPPRI